MSTVLLRTSSVLDVLAANDDLLSHLLAFADRPVGQDGAIMHSWCKVVRQLIQEPRRPVFDAMVCSAVPQLVAHVADDSVCSLLTEMLSTVEGPVGMATCLASAATDPVPRLMKALLHTTAAARNASDVLSAMCLAVTEAQDTSAYALLWRALAPCMDAFLADALPPGGGGARRAGRGGAPFHPRVEHGLSFLVELLMVHTRVGNRCETPVDGGICRLLPPHCAALRDMLRAQQPFVQLKGAEVLTVALVLVEEADEDPMAVEIVRAQLLSLSVELFFTKDVNGGGRQDFLRHVLLRVFCEALACDNRPVHKQLLQPDMGNLLNTIVYSLEHPGLCGSVTHSQMALRLVNDAAERVPFICRLTARTPRWAEWVERVLGAAAAETMANVSSPEAEGDENARPNQPAGPAPAIKHDAVDEGDDADCAQLSDALEQQSLDEGPFGALALHVGPSSPVISQGSARAPLGEPASDPNVLVVVDDATYKSSGVQYYDTPKPKLIKRAYYSRSAKISSPFFKSPGAGVDAALAEDAARRNAAGAADHGLDQAPAAALEPAKALLF